jgi:transposase
MYIETVKNRDSPPCILLRESYRQGGKVKKRTLANLTKWPNKIIENFRELLKGGIVVESIQDSFEVIRSLPHGHVAAVIGSLQKIGLERIIDSKKSRQRDIVMAMITARILSPSSKLATSRGFKNETAFTTLSTEYKIDDVDKDELYEAMDWLLTRQESIENSLARKHLKDGTFVLYDLTSSYMEGRCCPLSDRGHPRDKKTGKLQIEYGLLCDFEGRPVSVEVFEGNTGDPATVSNQIYKLQKRFGLKRVVIVGDRGMLTEARIREEFRGKEGLDWISALRGPAIKKLIESKTIQPSLFDELDLAEISSPDYPGERLLVCRNPLLMEERRRKREDLLQATEKELEKITLATRRKSKPLRGKAQIGVRAGKVINKYKMGKHFELKMTYASFGYERKNKEIKEEEALDGFYVVRTSLSKETISAEKTVEAYKQLSVVERAFRCLKTVDLKIRPVYHYLEDRVRAHVFLCMLAYYVEWHMRQLLAPILFDDHDKEAVRKLPRSVVAPAPRSHAAVQKERTKHTDDGMPVHSFQTLLQDLATVVKDWCQPKIVGAPIFNKITRLTPVQKKTFQLLGIRMKRTQ